MIMLVDKEKKVLRYSAGYGQDLTEEELLKDTEFHLNNPDSKGLFVLAIKEQRPFLINNVSEIQNSLSRRSFANRQAAGQPGVDLCSNNL